MALKQIKSLVQFARGTSVVLTNLATPIPDGVVTFSIDDGAFKLGDGITMYSALPTLFTYADLISAQGGLSNLFEEPAIAQNGKIAIIKFDSMTNKIYYGVSDVSLADLLSSVSQLESENLSQDTAISTLMTSALSIDAGINTANDNNLVTINSRRYSNSGSTVTNIQDQVAALASFEPGSHLLEPVFYVDVNKTTILDKENLFDNNTYYVDVKGFNNEANLVYTLTAANSNITITQIEGSLFSFHLNNITGAVKDNVPFALTVGIDTVDGKSPMRKAVGCKAYYRNIITGIYGGTAEDVFQSVAIAPDGNIFAVGHTLSEGLGGTVYGDALIVKFDSSLNIIALKRYGAIDEQHFNSVAIDSNGNIFVAGFHNVSGYSSNMLVVKFDNSLNLISSKTFSGAASREERFYDVAIDSGNNVICVGYTNSEGLGSSTYVNSVVVKFDNNLAVIARKNYSGSYDDKFQGVITDSANNIICVGYTKSEGTGSTTYSNILIIKFDSSLNILFGKVYSGANDEEAYGVTVDSSNNIICVGYTKSEGVGSTTYANALVIKFDPSLNILFRKVCSGTNIEFFKDVEIDSNNNIICVGHTKSEGVGTTTYDNALVVKFDSSLNVITSNIYGGVLNDLFYGLAIDANDNIICVGYTTSEGLGNGDCLIVKFPANIPSGSFTGITISGLTLVNATDFIMTNSGLTLTDSALTLTTNTLTLAETTLTLANSALTYEREVLN